MPFLERQLHKAGRQLETLTNSSRRKLNLRISRAFFLLGRRSVSLCGWSEHSGMRAPQLYVWAQVVYETIKGRKGAAQCHGRVAA